MCVCACVRVLACVRECVVLPSVSGCVHMFLYLRRPQVTKLGTEWVEKSFLSACILVPILTTYKRCLSSKTKSCSKNLKDWG